ncbi:class II glutamine amidotransferase [Motiliproteus coralliicola]|uniref:Class II glutamine amidotransferase n=1 Tax=Motiliproteus coralliicola TaxID=2283196 RepID=A0A369WT22_9GAMM|nr:class II glutamine amidotransferase [Motiliproteus coralliicola]RDE25248.1 class II glutamine amidotransferase [Motiliproteus coralliicola]
MCELLGMSANVPTDICFSFAGLMQRGGQTGPHRDGWGIAFYEGKGVRSFHDPEPSSCSRIAQLVREHPIKSHVVISHIRQANVGKISLENTHPFSRELWGQHWTFAHNGQLDKKVFDWPLGFYRPVGTTDSEYAMCWLLGKLRDRYDSPPAIEELSATIQQLCDQLRELGVYNMLLTDSHHLFAYCTTKLTWITRRAPFGEASLKDDDLVVDFCKETQPNDVVTVIATEPLTDNETWHRMETGEMQVFVEGLPLNSTPISSV